jgi:hypothetical protein
MPLEAPVTMANCRLADIAPPRDLSRLEHHNRRGRLPFRAIVPDVA